MLTFSNDFLRFEKFDTQQKRPDSKIFWFLPRTALFGFFGYVLTQLPVSF